MARLKSWGVVHLGANFVHGRGVPNHSSLAAHSSVWVVLWDSCQGRGDYTSEAILPLVHDDEDPSFLSIMPNLLCRLVQMTFQAGMGVCPNSLSFLHMSSDLNAMLSSASGLLEQ